MDRHNIWLGYPVCNINFKASSIDGIKRNLRKEYSYKEFLRKVYVDVLDISSGRWKGC